MKHIRKFNDNPERKRTELELHCIQLFKKMGEPIDEEYYQNTHILSEFIDGYSRKRNGKYSYASPKNYEEDAKLIENFLRIATKDKEGNYEYSANDFDNYIKPALEQFGL